jgi:cytoskeletal protein CcmA (bactofilin family)
MSSSNAYPLFVSGTIRTQRIHYIGNPFNNDPSSNLAAHRIDGLNESFNTTMYDLANNTTASYVRQTVNTGSNFVRTQLLSQNAGFDAILNLANYGGNGILTSNVNTEITGTLKIATPTTQYAQVELSGSIGGGILQSKGDLYVQGHVYGNTTSIGDVILTATGSKSVRVTSNTFNVTSNTNVTGTFNVQGTSKFTGSINGSSDITVQGLASFDAGKVQVQDADGSSPKVAIGDGVTPYPGMGVNIDTDKNPGNIYAYFAIDDAGTGSANKGGIGLSVQTFTAYGSDTVGSLYGGLNGNDGTNNIMYSVGGTAQITKDTGLTGSLKVTGSVAVTGSVQGNVNNLTVSSNTASLNLNNGNFFVLALTGSQNIFINPSNIKPGQTVNIKLNTTGSGTVSFPTSVKQVSGSSYTPTTAVGTDIITLVSFDTTSLYLANVKNLV